MKYLVLFAVLAAALALPSVLFAQDPAGQGDGQAGAQIALEKQKLQIEEMRAEAEFRHQMRQMELEHKKLDVEARRRQIHGGGGGGGGAAGLLLLALAVIHVLAAVWVYLDIRQRNAGSGLWIVLTLFSGLFGALVYVVSRLGDSRNSPAPSQN